MRIEPIAPAAPGQNQYIGFYLTADGVDGPVRVRFPESVISKQGYHFLDNAQPEIKRVSNVRVPTWQRSCGDGRIGYAVKTAEGIDFAGTAAVVGDAVEMALTVTNRSDAAQDINLQVCIDFSLCASLGATHTAAGIFAVRCGQPTEFTALTAAGAAAKQQRTGYPWILMLTGDGPHDDLYRLESDCPWWIADQRADEPLIWRQSRDGRHLLAVAWDKQTVCRLMSNTSIPCLHADPLEVRGLAPGQSKTWHGRLLLMENNPDALLKAYHRKH